MGDVVLARGNGRDVARERLRQRRFIGREWRQRAAMRLAGHRCHVMQRPVAGGCEGEKEHNDEQ